MDILISIGATIAGYTVEPVGHQLGYLCFYKRNIDELKAQIICLGRAEERLQGRAADAKRNGEDIKAEVAKLLTDIHKIVEDNEEFLRDEEQSNTKCCTGAFLIPNLVLRYRLSRRVRKTAQGVVTHITSIENYDNVEISYCPHKPSLVEVKGYEEFQSRNQILAEIMRAVRDPDVRVLGVWGMGGVGKTMLTKAVARLAKDEEKLFSEVVFTTISATPNVEKIQEDIRKCLGMDTHHNIGERIKNRLTKENNILVIVDDVWKKIELEDVGIFFGKDHKGCKILVTSRYQNVLNNMDVDKIFPVGVLLEDEAMNLFSKIVGDKAKEHDFQALTTEIVKECGGLPIAITTVASALKSSPHQVWNNALYELRKSDPVNIDGMDEKVYSSIKLSYDFLRSNEAKKLLLLCSLFEEDAEIPVELLCNYGIGLNLFEGASKLEAATNKTITLVETLKDHSLLLSGSRKGDNFVRLHDVIRDVVISIASKDDEAPMYNFRDALELEEFLATEKFKKSTAISLYHIKANGYPETLKSPKLKLLRLIQEYHRNELMYGNKVEFQHHFFEGLDQLFVLDLERVSLKPPPASTFCLVKNLQTLRLIGCDLADISWIGELNNLKILDLSKSSIIELPKEIGKLNRMLSLNLQWCPGLKVIRPNVISRLTRLEELNLPTINWDNDEGVVNGDDERPNASLEEVKNLPYLTNLSLRVPDINTLPNNMFSNKLDKFNIRIGTHSFYFKRMSSRMLTLKLCPDCVLKEHDFEVLLKRSESLHLIGLKSAKSVAYELDSMGFPQLEDLKIEDSTEILCILNSNWNRAAFGKLRHIDVIRCPKLKSLLPIDILKQLESIKVKNCKRMKKIISDGREGDGDLLKISELRELELDQLPKLVQFKVTRKSDEAQSIDHSVAPLFNEEVLFPKLEKITLVRLNVGKLWNGDQLRSSEFGFQSLMKLIVSQCDQLKGLIPLSVARNLVHLEELIVNNCKAIEEVVFLEESTQEVKAFENISFRKLKTLKLLQLPNLKRLYAGDYINIDCPSLLKLQISNCPKLGDYINIDCPSLLHLKVMNDDCINTDYIDIDTPPYSELRRQFLEFSINTMLMTENENFEDLLDHVDKQLLFNHKVLFPKLEDITLERLNIGKIWTGDHLRSSELNFQGLTSLILLECDELKGLIPSSMVRNLVNLKGLVVDSCRSMEEVVFIEESTQEAKTFENMSFHKLETLLLYNLPNLKRFYAGDYINIDCPSLLKLEIRNCPKLQEFSTNTIPTTENENFEDLLDHVDKQFLFNHKVLFPKLKELTLSQLIVRKIWNGDQLRSSEFGFKGLTTLVVIECNQLKGVIPSSVVRSLVDHLKHVRVESCKAVEEIVFIDEFTHEAFENIPFPKLKSLRLYELRNLKRIYALDCVDCSSLKLGTENRPTANENIEALLEQVDKQPLLIHKDLKKADQLTCTQSSSSPNLEQIYKTFQTLQIIKCDALKVFAPSSMSLQSLAVLKVESCSGLTSTFFHRSIAKSLSQLRELSIVRCPNLRQVMANDNKEAHDDLDGIADDIVFSQLVTLILVDLSSLEIFYLGDCVLKFPRLKNLVVDCCFEMKTFSHGNIENCSMLNKIVGRNKLKQKKIPDNIDEYLIAANLSVNSDLYKHWWEGDINTTIQKIWKDENDSSFRRSVTLISEENMKNA